MPRPATARLPLLVAAALAAAAVVPRANAALQVDIDGASFTANNVDVPYGSVAYAVTAPAPFVKLRVAASCALASDVPPIARPAVAYVNFDEANAAGCASYAELVARVLPLVDASVFVLAQRARAKNPPGYNDVYGPHAAYDPPRFAITVISGPAGVALEAALAQAADPAAATATVTSGVNEWADFATSPGIVAFRVFQTVTTFAALAFIVTNLVLTARAHGLRQLLRLTLGVRLQLCLLGLFAFRFIQAAVDPVNSSRTFGPFPVHQALLYSGFFCGTCAFAVLLIGWARASAWAHARVDWRSKLLWTALIYLTVALFFIASSLLVAAAFQATAGTALDRAADACLYVVGAVILLLCFMAIALGVTLLRILDPGHWANAHGADKRSSRLLISPEKVTMLRKISGLVIVASVGFIGLLIDVLAGVLFYITPNALMGIIWMQSVLTLMICLAMLATLRYDSLHTSLHSSSHNNSHPRVKSDEVVSLSSTLESPVGTPELANSFGGGGGGVGGSSTSKNALRTSFGLMHLLRTGSSGSGAPSTDSAGGSAVFKVDVILSELSVPDAAVQRAAVASPVTPSSHYSRDAVADEFVPATADDAAGDAV